MFNYFFLFFSNQNYQKYIVSKEGDGSALDSIIKFLAHTSEIVELINEKCAISNENDSRL